MVGGVFLEVECCGSRDVGCREGWAGAVAGGDAGGGCIDDAGKSANDFDESVLHAKEPRVNAAMPEEELMVEVSVGVCEGTVMWLEDGAGALARGEDVDSHEEVVVCQHNDVPHG